MAHNTQLSACSSRICKPSAVVRLFCCAVVFLTSMFFWKQLRVELRPQLASVGLFFINLVLDLIHFLHICAFLHLFLTCFCSQFPFEQIKQDAQNEQNNSPNPFSQLHNLWPNPSFARTRHEFVHASVNGLSPDNSFLFMGCVRKAGAIFDRMFGTLAGGSQRADGVLIPSVAFLPPILHSTYHSVLTCSRVVVLLFLQKKNAFLMHSLPSPRTWMQHALEEIGFKNMAMFHVTPVCMHPAVCDVFMSLLYKINKHQRLNVR